MIKVNAIMAEIMSKIADLQALLASSDTLDKDEIAKMQEELTLLSDIVDKYYHGYIDFEFIVDNMGDSISITNAAGELMYVNKAWVKQNKMNPEDVIGKTMTYLTESTEFGESVVNEVITTMQPHVILSNSLKHDFNLSGHSVGVPLFGPNGDLKYVVASLRPLSQFASLKSDFKKFVDEITAASKSMSSTLVLQDTSEIADNPLVYISQEMEQVWSLVGKVAPTDATILIQGESGTGKEIVADEIYRLSSRSNKPFVKINCASIPENLMESELFGYEKGAFSGANANGKKGLFELANGGTVLLDEIGEMPMNLQAKLLRVLQSNSVIRVGGTQPIDLDVRVISSTNSDLPRKIQENTFRLDLYYRLNIIPIHIPPLRERPKDIPAFCDFFISMFNKKYSHSFALSEAQKQYLEGYSWPGNVRELRNIIEYLVICFSDVENFTDEDLHSVLEASTAAIANEQETALVSYSYGRKLSEYMAECERNVLKMVLNHSRTMSDAARELGIDISTVSRKIKQYGLDFNS